MNTKKYMPFQPFAFEVVEKPNDDDYSGVIQFLPVQKTPSLNSLQKKAGCILHEKDGKNTRLLVSIGEKDKLTLEIIRIAAAACARYIYDLGGKRFLVQLPYPQKKFGNKAVAAIAEGFHLGAYKFYRYKSGFKKPHKIRLDIAIAKKAKQLRTLIEQTGIITESVNFARDIANQPANIINPISLSEIAKQVAETHGMKCIVLDEKQLKAMGAGSILSVGQGSKTPSRMIILEHNGKMLEEKQRPVVLVGKAITFDTGGYSLKPTTGIQGMKFDKCGGVYVLAIMSAISQLKVEIPVVGIICAAENMISQDAYRPDDIITALSGKTIEIISTDAEGRLVLADGITYAEREYKPRAIIDLATLTGGIVVALGNIRAGMMSNDDKLSKALFQSGENTHERLWRMPLDDDYLEATKGVFADLKNSGGRQAQPIMGGIFLKQFIEQDTPWAHLDIAGLASSDKETGYAPKGASGFGVRLMTDYLMKLKP